MAMTGIGDYVPGVMTTRLTFFGALAAIAMVLSTSSPGQAAKPKATPPAAPAGIANPGPAHPLGTAGAWTAYLSENKAGKVCYLVGQPEKSEPSKMQRRTVMAMITHRTEDRVADVVSFDEGYPLNEGKDVQLEVGANKFELFAKDDTAWARTSELDLTIVTALAKEKQAVVRATPRKGPATTDTYSLVGFAKALALIDKACDVKR